MSDNVCYGCSDECGEPHNDNRSATPDEIALIDSLRAEVGL